MPHTKVTTTTKNGEWGTEVEPSPRRNFPSYFVTFVAFV